MADEFTDRLGNRIDLKDHNSWLGRLGIAYEYTDPEAAGAGLQLRVIANLLHDFSEDTEVRVNGAVLKEAVDVTWGEIGVGGTVALNPQTFLYGEVAYRSTLSGDKGDDRGTSLNLGIRRVW
jgi:fibronectin-binding autotransporter adhesin